VNGGRTTATVLTALTLVALPLAGCGKEKPKIPRSDARSLVALLETVKRQTDAHACTTVERTIASLERRTEALPSNTDGDVRSSLRDGIANLRELVRSDCFPSQKKPKTESTDTTTSEPDTSTDTTSDTNTDTTTDTTTETTPPDTNTNTDTTPPDNGNTDTTPSGGVGPPGQQKKNGGKK
jgi:hypothetical protein